MIHSTCLRLASLAVLCGAICVTRASAAITADLEDISLPANSYLNGGPNTSTNMFNSHGVLFPNSYDATFDFWVGWAIANKTDVTTPGFGNQYSAYNLPSGGGAGPS